MFLIYGGVDMRVHLKGIHWATKTLSNGEKVRYHYAWKGGPRIKALPGTEAFLKEVIDHRNRQKHHRKKEPTIADLIAQYQASTDFTELAEKTRKDYRSYLSLIEEKFGTMPLKAAEDPRARGVFKDWRDSFSSTPRKADYLWTNLARLLSFGKDRGKLRVNVCERGGRLYTPDRREAVWSEVQVSAFLALASRELQLALLLALWTGQRQGDLLTLQWEDIVDGAIRLRQSKRGARVVVPVSATLKAALEVTERRANTILTNTRGNPWTQDGFRASWNMACHRAGITGVTFNDLRGTAVTRLALAGCTVPEIAAITGHSLQDVQQLLDAHYLGGRVQLAEQAMQRLEVFSNRGSNQAGPEAAE
jgi:integrase